MKKIILTVGILALFSFNENEPKYKEKAFEALQVQEVLREELFNIYLQQGTLEAESRYVDAKYVESLLKEILNNTN